MKSNNESSLHKRDRVMKKVLNCIGKEGDLKEPLSEYLQYQRFLEHEIIPAIGEKKFELYLYKLTLKAIGSKEIPTLRQLRMANIYATIFKSGAQLSKEAIEKYPNTRRICENVIKTIKVEQLSDIDSILTAFEDRIYKRESLANPTNHYKQNVSWRYLIFVERAVLDHIGEAEFLSYTQDYLLNGFNKGLLKNYSFAEASRYIFEERKCDTNENHILINNNDRYPRLKRIIKKAIDNILNMNTMGERRLTNGHLISKVSHFNKMSEQEFVDLCIEIISNKFHVKRKRITRLSFLRELFKEPMIHKRYTPGETGDSLIHIDIMNNLLEKESINQVKLFKEWNRQSVKYENDIWQVYFLRGLSINSLTINFTIVNSDSLRMELKKYLYSIHNPDTSEATYRVFCNIIRALKILEKEFGIVDLLDLNRFQVAYLLKNLEYVCNYSVSSIKGTIGSLSNFTAYTLSEKTCSSQEKENIFKKITVHNSANMSKNTDFIPDLVIEQISRHISELDPIYQLMYELYSYTGLRAKEVIESTKNDYIKGEIHSNYVKIEYVPYKILHSRKKRGLPEKQFVYIPLKLYQKVMDFITKNEDIYNEHRMEHVFVRRTGRGINIVTSASFCRAINMLIKKYEICDVSGKLWHFSTKQIRKTVAVNLIENDATPQEVANQLGHMSTSTTEMYYIEVKKAKLAELNTEFFKRKFEMNLGEDNLSLYSEEERKQLYIDFCLNKRAVEFGTCTKHPSEGSCGSRVGASSCAICPKLCTGKKYLSKWINLKDSQTEIVDELTKIYKENRIEDYASFIEYKKETKLLERYSTVVEEIINHGEVK